MSHTPSDSGRPVSPAADAMPERPILLMVGAARSGTTLLREMLNAHPQLNCFGELIYATLGVEDGRFPSAEAYRQLLQRDRIYNLHRFPLVEGDDHRAVVRGLLESARTLGPDRPWVGATLHHHLDLLPQIWPEAKYLHVLRDPRDVARSALRLGWHGHAYFGVDRWLEAHRQWGRLAKQIPASAQITVRFEDLVTAPERELRRCCDLLGVAFEPAMLRFDTQSVYDQPDATLIEQWKRKLDARTIGLIEGRLGSALEEAGYAPSGHPVVRPGRLELAKLRRIDRWGRMRYQQRRFGARLWVSGLLVNRGWGPAGWRERVRQRRHAIQNAAM